MNTVDITWLYAYQICVPFGNTNYDTQLYASHDLDIATPPNTPITALLPGIISSIEASNWGKTIGIMLDVSYNSIPYMGYLHLSAVNPALQIGQHVSIGGLLGWSGGCTDASQYAGTSNPTGENFLNTPDQSSQPQTGIAFMRGPSYGSIGWENFPPIDWALDPTSLVWKMRAAYDTWLHGSNSEFYGGIGQSWFEKYVYVGITPPATSGEYPSHDWAGKSIIVREFGTWRCEWSNNSAHWYKY